MTKHHHASDRSSQNGSCREWKRPQLHLVSDGRLALQPFVQAVQAAAPWIDVVHIREKKRPAKEIAEWARYLQLHLPSVDQPEAKRVAIAINDRVDVAWACGTRVQLAGHSLSVHEVKQAFPGIIVGCSVHSREEAEQMEAAGADYVLYGHIFPTASKPDLPARGLEELRQVCDAVRIPVIAIGGIQPENTVEVIRAGASGIAVMSGILQADDPARAARLYREALAKLTSPR